MTRIMIDYGHGGSDSGAVYKGRKESDDVLKLGLEVAKELRRHGILIDETRTKDTTVSLKERSDVENKKTYNYFISFHRNGFKPEEALGVETFTYINQTAKSRELAEKIQKSLVAIGFKDRGVKKANFHVLRETKSPAVLVEIGFIDNTKDNEIFDSKFNQIVEGVTRAMLEQFGIRYIEVVPKPDNKKLYRVQVGAYSKKENAEILLKKLKDKGFDAFIRYD